MPQVPSPALPEVDPPRVPAMCLADGATQALGGLRDNDQVNMIGHQAICPDRDLLRAAELRHELEIVLVVFLTEERLLSAVSPLGDMVGHARSYHTCQSSHGGELTRPQPRVKSWVWCPRNSKSLTVAHTWRHHRRQGTSGHVRQGRFRSPVIQDGDHLLVVLRYIEANPVRAAMVADPCEYTWSSHRCHGAGHADPILDSFPEWEQLGRTEPERRARWRGKVRKEQPAKELDGVRSSVRSGRPYGAEDWVEVISHRLGIVREPRRRGRPPREKMLRHRNSRHDPLGPPVWAVCVAS